MNRADLQNLTEIRLSDAKALLATGSNDAGAYYMAGSAVECALKAVTAKNQGEYPFPPRLADRELAQKYYTHDVTVLLTTAGLEAAFGQQRANNPVLASCWNVVVDWNETLRYQVHVSRQKAEELVLAIEEPANGVLQWLKNFW